MLLDENKALREQLHKLTETDLTSVIVEPPIVDPEPDGDPRPALPQRISNDNSPQVRLVAMSKNNQASIAFNKKQYNKAIDLFQDAVKSEPKSALIHYNLGCTYLAMREKAKSIECLREAVALDPKFKEAHYNLALAWSRRGYRQEAIDAAQKALKIDENYLPARELLKIIE